MKWKSFVCSSFLSFSFLLSPLVAHGETLIQSNVEEPVPFSIQLRNGTEQTIDRTEVEIKVYKKGETETPFIQKVLPVTQSKPNSNTVIGTSVMLDEKGEYEVIVIPKHPDLQAEVIQADIDVQLSKGLNETEVISINGSDVAIEGTSINATTTIEEETETPYDTVTIGVPKTGDGSSQSFSMLNWWYSLLVMVGGIIGWVFYKKKGEQKREIKFPW